MPDITIDRLAFGGAGFGRIDGKACFVRYTAPGDVADVSILRSKSSYAEGGLTALKAPATCRVTPLCPVFGICGGCDWQHIDYEEQCRQKEQILADALWRAARLDAGKILPIRRAPSPFAYRQRIQLKIHAADGNLGIGFYRAGSHFVVDIGDCCAISVPAINRVLPEVRRLIIHSAEAERIHQVDLIASPDNQVVAIFHYIGSKREHLASWLAANAMNPAVLAGISIQSGRKSTLQHLFGPELMTYGLPSCKGEELEIHYSPDGFSQVNFSQNRALVAALIDLCATLHISSILDLYCGNGNFSLPLARNAEKIVGFESYAKSTLLAGQNARVNGINHARYICKDSASGLEQLSAGGELFDLVIIDPPRTGAADVARILSRSKATRVIYISCDPPTLARDICILQKGGFQVMFVQPVDMFPQTYHLESLTFLERIT